MVGAIVITIKQKKSLNLGLNLNNTLMLIGLFGLVFISYGFGINIVCLSSTCILGFLIILSIYKTKLNDYFNYLSRYFNTAPKPHGFASLPLESQAGM